MSDVLPRALAIMRDALDLAEHDRADFVERACGSDAELRREVQAFFEHDSAKDERFDEQHVGRQRAQLSELADQAGESPENHPARIGEFRIVRVIGRGGMGVVYEAEQENPRRSVALKVLATGATTEQGLARFRHEIQVLGLLKDDGIAQIYEAGTYDPGTGEVPFFAMELVEGESLLVWARRSGLTMKGKLDVFRHICTATHHAHMRGVVHRDLKPENIIVTASGVPKILDFGIASATGADIALTTMHTNAGQLVGTVAYMSPEQARGDVRDVDARSDIYTLGVLLFQLLSDRFPHDVRGRSLPDALRAIQEDEPTSLKSLDTAWRGDLDTIVRHALEKAPERRYSSAEQFGADVGRFLRDEPVLAEPPSTAYQLRKFARRHRGLTVGLVLAFVALSVGLATAVHFALGEARQRHLAEQQRGQANRTAYRMAMNSAGSALESGRVFEAEVMLDATSPGLRGWEWHHLHSSLETHLWGATVLNAPITHDGMLTEAEVCFSSDGALVFALQGPERIGVWKASTGELARSIDAGTELLAHLLASGGGALAVATQDQRLLVFDEDTGAMRFERTFEQPITALAWDSTGGQLALALDMSSKEQRSSALLVGPPDDLRELLQHAHVVRGVAWASRGEQLVVIDDRMPRDSTVNITVRTIDARTGETLAFYADSSTGHQVRPYTASASASADGDALLVGSAHQFVDVFDLQAGTKDGRFAERASRMTGHAQSEVRDASVVFDGSRAATVTQDGLVVVWDLATGTALARHQVVGAKSCAIDPQGTRVAVNGGGELVVWDLESPVPRILRGHSTHVYSIEFSPDGRLIASLDYAQQVRLWDAQGGAFLGAIGPGMAVCGSPWQMVLMQWAWAADGQSLVVNSPSGWGRAELTADLEFTPGSRRVPGLESVASAAWKEFAGGAQSTQGFEFGPDGDVVLDLQRAVLVDPRDGRELRRLEGQRPYVCDPELANFSASFSPDGRRVGVARHEAIIFDVGTGTRIGALAGDGVSAVYAIAWSPSGTRLATGSSNGEIGIWDAETLQPILVLRGHSHYVHDLSWSPDGTQLVSASGDGTVAIWDSRTVAERGERARAARTLRAELEPRIECLLEELGDPLAVADRLEGAADLQGDRGREAFVALLELLARRAK